MSVRHHSGWEGSKLVIQLMPHCARQSRRRKQAGRAGDWGNVGAARGLPWSASWVVRHPGNPKGTSTWHRVGGVKKRNGISFKCILSNLLTWGMVNSRIKEEWHCQVESGHLTLGSISAWHLALFRLGHRLAVPPGDLESESATWEAGKLGSTWRARKWKCHLES